VATIKVEYEFVFGITIKFLVLTIAKKDIPRPTAKISRANLSGFETTIVSV
jgi:hypothetical protein